MNIHSHSRLANVLLVEDSLMDIDLTRELLALEAIRVQMDVVRDGDEACDYLCRRGSFVNAPIPDIVLLDLSLPKVDGWQVLKFVKSHPGLNHIAVIVLSGSDFEKDIAEAKLLGASEYLVKPLTMEALKRLTNNCPTFSLESEKNGYSLCVACQ